METKETTAINSHFRDFIEALTIKDYNDVRKRIIRECKITDQVYRNWRNGNSSIPELAKPIINEIAGYEVFKLNEND